MRIGFALLAVLGAAVIGACAVQAPPPPPQFTVSSTLTQATPPPTSSTPVPVIHAKSIPGAGRPDPFVALYGPPSESSNAKPPKSVSVSSFPKIPTLPGFENGPGGTVKSVWDGIALTGIVRDRAYTAIVQVDTSSYIVRQGDSVAGKFRVATIGPDFITLDTLGSPRLERTFSLGG